MTDKKSFSQYAFYPGSDRARMSDVTFHSTIFQTRDESALRAVKGKLQSVGVSGAEHFNVSSSLDGLNIHDLEYNLGLKRINNPDLAKVNEAERIW